MNWTNQWYKLVRRWRVAAARRAGVECPADLRLAADVDFNLGGAFRNSTRAVNSPGRIVLGTSCWIERSSVLWAFDGQIVLGKNVFLGPQVVIYGHGGVMIGDDTLVSMQCRILSSNHGIPPAGESIRTQPDILLPTRIGSGCWIGAGATILGGVTLGDGSVVGAGAVVTTDVPPNTIVAGVPARMIKKRD